MNLKKISALALLGIVSFGNLPLSATSIDESNRNERVGTTVIPGNCTDMKRDHQYSTPGYFPVGGEVYNKTHNCENQSIADGYSGEVDVLVEKESTGSNLFHIQDVYLEPGESYTHHDYTANDSTQYVSTSDWESIDGEDLSGDKKIYASIE